MSRAALADVVMLVHAAFVLFVVCGLVAIWIGIARDRPFARQPAFRALHLAAIGLVALESVLGYACPLTLLEARLRGGDATTGFLQRAVQSWLYWDAPAWMFTVAYLAFGALVAWTWWRYPPRGRSPDDRAPVRRARVSRARRPC